MWQLRNCSLYEIFHIQKSYTTNVAKCFCMWERLNPPLAARVEYVVFIAIDTVIVCQVMFTHV